MNWRLETSKSFFFNINLYLFVWYKLKEKNKKKEAKFVYVWTLSIGRVCILNMSVIFSFYFIRFIILFFLFYFYPDVITTIINDSTMMTLHRKKNYSNLRFFRIYYNIHRVSCGLILLDKSSFHHFGPGNITFFTNFAFCSLFGHFSSILNRIGIRSQLCYHSKVMIRVPILWLVHKRQWWWF